MCGIAGILSTKGDICGTESVLAMSRQMARRGPDDEGYIISDSEGNLDEFYGPTTPQTLQERHREARQIGSALKRAGRIFFAHRRLSIRDVSHLGHQPMPDKSGRYWLIYNGEIFNADEVQADLRPQGFIPVGNSDTEILISAFANWRERALNRLNGMFAFGIWDRQERSLFLARDRIGIKPLYYWHDSQRGLFLFGSDIKTLLASGVFKASINMEGFYHALSFGVCPRPLTVFQGVRALRPGHWMKINCDGVITSACWWQLPVGEASDKVDEGEAIENIRSGLFESVERQLVSDTEVGVYMSGGIDSTSVTAAAALYQPNIRAVTLGYSGAGLKDEIAEATAFSSLHPIRHEVKRVSSEELLSHINEAILCYEEPCALFSPNQGIAKLAAEKSLKVVLSGLGGDELFGGYGRYDFLNTWRWSRRLRLISGVLGALGRRGKLLAELSNIESPCRLHGHLLGRFPDGEKQALMVDPQAKEFSTLDRLEELYIPDGMEFSSDFEAMSYMDIVHYIGNHHVYRLDQFTMWYSIEGRFPMLDHSFVESAFRLPEALKIRNGERKWILRRAMESYLHPSSLVMRKRGFSFPSDEWLRHGPLMQLKVEAFSGLKERGIFSAKKLDQFLIGFENDQVAADLILRFMAVEFWLKTFIDHSPS